MSCLDVIFLLCFLPYFLLNSDVLQRKKSNLLPDHVFFAMFYRCQTGWTWAATIWVTVLQPIFVRHCHKAQQTVWWKCGDYNSVAVLFLISNSSNSSLQLRPFAGCPVLQGLGLARLGIWTCVTWNVKREQSETSLNQDCNLLQCVVNCSDLMHISIHLWHCHQCAVFLWFRTGVALAPSPPQLVQVLHWATL